MAGSTPISEIAATAPATEPQKKPQSAAERDLWIFRDGRVSLSGPCFLKDLLTRIREACTSTMLLDVLIQAGELESALGDLDSPSLPFAATLTDEAAKALCGQNSRLAECLREFPVPEQISIAPPEGFTYYALHPLDYARSTAEIVIDGRPVAVIGVRSIGTTLSAVVLAQLHGQNCAASRITVRPIGHPYSRRTDFTAEQLSWVHAQNSANASFLVVDEGPGRSGSTFLSVAEALLGAGVARERITMLGSRQPELHSLCADNAAERWQSFRFASTSPAVNQRFKDYFYVGGGEWRKHFLAQDEPWPAVWTQMERLKFLSPDKHSLFKFEGMGPIGKAVRERAAVLAANGFGPECRNADDGFLEYSVLEGQRPRSGEVTTEMLNRIAEYCAFRGNAFAVPQTTASELAKMVAYNIEAELGTELPAESLEALCAAASATIADGKMQPYEWVESSSGVLIKTDGVDHGDNHFFPGPCDITWDLAGVAIEWQLSSQAVHHLLTEFSRQTGRNVAKDLDAYLLAYCVFRLGSCKMAISTVHGSPEEVRLTRAYHWYRNLALKMLARHGCSVPV